MNKAERINTFKKTMWSIFGDAESQNEMFEYLEYNNYFAAPASGSYHGNYEGGLFDHSWAVAKMLVELTEKNDLQWADKRSPYIVGLFHDLCKMDEYVSVENYRTQEILVGGEYKKFTGKQGTKYVRNKYRMLKGHGEKSVLLAQQLLKLTEEELFCIRYHMGAYETDAWNGYGDAIKKHNNVLWTHQADMLVSKVLGV